MKVYIYNSKKPDTSSLLRDQNGKPLPIDNTHFNISHSGNYWAIAISDKSVGIDLQSKFKTSREQGHTNANTNPRESTNVNTIPREISERTMKKILKPGEKPVKNNYLHNFVIKEAYAKLLGAGLSLGFSNYDANGLIKNPHYFKETKDYICYAFEKPENPA